MKLDTNRIHGTLARRLETLVTKLPPELREEAEALLDPGGEVWTEFAAEQGERERMALEEQHEAERAGAEAQLREHFGEQYDVRIGLARQEGIDLLKANVLEPMPS